MNYPVRLRQLGCEPPDDPPGYDIEALESAIGVPLPASYRAFLAVCGGWANDLSCPCREPTPFGEHSLSGFHDATEVRGFLDSMITPRNMVAIGYGHFGAFTCLSVAGIDRGSVYALDSEFRVYWTDQEFHERFNALAESIQDYLALRGRHALPAKPIGYDSLYLLADSFEEFLTLCRPCLADD